MANKTFRIEFHAVEVLLQHLNVRTETHGDDDVTAIDLKLRWTSGNEALLQFHPKLRGAIYEPPPPTQEPVEGVEPGLPVLVFADLAPLHWQGEAPCTLALHHGLGDGADIVLPDATADGFVLEALTGGTVNITFRVKSVCLDERILGRLPLLLHRYIPATLLPVSRRAKRKADEDGEGGDADGPGQGELLQ